MKELLGLTAALLAGISSFIYIRDIFRGNTRPHFFTWLIWAIVTIIAFLGQVINGAGPGAWPTGVSAILTVLVCLLCFKYGTEDITWLDGACLIGAFIAIYFWIFQKDVLSSVLLASFIDVIGFIPTMRKTWHAPRSESLPSMFYDAVKHALSIASLQTYSLVTWIYPAAVLGAKLVIIAEISFRRNILHDFKK